MTRKSDIAFFPGSFNPFTIGHKSVVDRGLGIFGRIIIGVGYNESKGTTPDEVDSRTKNIAACFRNDPRVEVIAYSGLTAYEAKRRGACAILRGIRSVADFESERTLADINRKLTGIETVILYALPEYESVSGSAVRELQHFGADVSEFLPETEK